MNKQQIIKQVKALHLPAGSYIVFGSCPLAAVGIRESNDIDLLVTEDVLEELKGRGWRQIDKGGANDKPYVHGVFEAHSNWNFSSYRPTLRHLLQTANRINGVPFASLEEVRKWKLSSGRPKDYTDIKLIDSYLAK
jgi:hypothetical protein